VSVSVCMCLFLCHPGLPGRAPRRLSPAQGALLFATVGMVLRAMFLITSSPHAPWNATAPAF